MIREWQQITWRQKHDTAGLSRISIKCFETPSACYYL
jgi:hypothetical protein